MNNVDTQFLHEYTYMIRVFVCWGEVGASLEERYVQLVQSWCHSPVLCGKYLSCIYGRKQNGSFSFKLENPPAGGRKRGGREGGRGGGGGGGEENVSHVEEATGATVCGVCSDLKD